MLDLAYLLGVLALFSLIALAAKGIEKLGGPPTPARDARGDR
ncbi:hypothetical protein [Rathayibacter iranicus]|uniref:Potassium-transporting ATPase subunit A n=1 Tax=Rathayibacter iranicus NCPPB 2253 = VKM Ac-1602 TaxID=1328868 RepID=A0ABX5LA16_9MICO|nr:hypothetical protein [Rathayibacter iranicus]PWJ61309.1 hypothetical protein B0H03_11828 [Rathayibacter iranicus NCPPB 2253 = VKM Ac-1602]